MNLKKTVEQILRKISLNILQLTQLVNHHINYSREEKGLLICSLNLPSLFKHKDEIECYYIIIKSTFLHLTKQSLMRQFQNVTPKSMVIIMNDMIVTDMVEVDVFI